MRKETELSGAEKNEKARVKAQKAFEVATVVSVDHPLIVWLEEKPRDPARAKANEEIRIQVSAGFGYTVLILRKIAHRSTNGAPDDPHITIFLGRVENGKVKIQKAAHIYVQMKGRIPVALAEKCHRTKVFVDRHCNGKYENPVIYEMIDATEPSE